MSGLVRTVDPAGFRLEIFYGQRMAHTPFVSSIGARFVTENLGLGHRCNQRHHTLALIDGAGARDAHHFMVEVADLDTVGLALDRAVDAGVPITMGIGRHTNDKMTSFFARTPSSIEVECGYGGLLVDEATWSVTELAKPSIWGHRGTLTARRSGPSCPCLQPPCHGRGESPEVWKAIEVGNDPCVVDVAVLVHEPVSKADGRGDRCGQLCSRWAHRGTRPVDSARSPSARTDV